MYHPDDVCVCLRAKKILTRSSYFSVQNDNLLGRHLREPIILQSSLEGNQIVPYKGCCRADLALLLK